MPQSLTSLHFHIVFSTKDRRNMIVDEFRDRLYEYIGGILHKNDSRLIAAGGMPDHIHLLASIGKELSISARCASLNPIRRNGFMRRIRSIQILPGRLDMARLLSVFQNLTR
jgi:REP element-mobilizing transposase RayT